MTDRLQKSQQQLQLTRYTSAVLVNQLRRTRFRHRYQLDPTVWFTTAIGTFVNPQELKAYVPERHWLPVRGALNG